MYFTNLVIATLVRRFFLSLCNHHQAIGGGSRARPSGQSQQTTGPRSRTTTRKVQSKWRDVFAPDGKDETFVFTSRIWLFCDVFTSTSFYMLERLVQLLRRRKWRDKMTLNTHFVVYWGYAYIHITKANLLYIFCSFQKYFMLYEPKRWWFFGADIMLLSALIFWWIPSSFYTHICLPNVMLFLFFLDDYS